MLLLVLGCAVAFVGIGLLLRFIAFVGPVLLILGCLFFFGVLPAVGTWVHPPPKTSVGFLTDIKGHIKSRVTGRWGGGPYDPYATVVIKSGYTTKHDVVGICHFNDTSGRELYFQFSDTLDPGRFTPTWAGFGPYEVEPRVNVILKEFPKTLLIIDEAPIFCRAGDNLAEVAKKFSISLTNRKINWVH